MSRGATGEGNTEARSSFEVVGVNVVFCHSVIKTFWHRGRAWIRVYALARFWMFDITNIATYALHQLTDILFLYKRIQN